VIQLCLFVFGTGFSSLFYLHAFPFDTLKIERSFVGQIDTESLTRGLIETIVALSRNLGMGAVVEGVETAEQLAFLRRVGPQFAQGYLFSKALAPDEVEDMLARNPVW
jgi:EAL domain-containing protein (putative c-di-GMP-specific phosphodiesterase class I)